MCRHCCIDQIGHPDVGGLKFLDELQDQSEGCLGPAHDAVRAAVRVAEERRLQQPSNLVPCIRHDDLQDEGRKFAYWDFAERWWVRLLGGMHLRYRKASC